jgi:hypothetical protein
MGIANSLNHRNQLRNASAKNKLSLVSNGPSTQQLFLSFSDVIARTRFGHTTIIKWQTVLYCPKLFA